MTRGSAQTAVWIEPEATTGFLDLLPTRGMKTMLAHWVKSRTGQQSPHRPPFDPLCLPAELPYIQLHERHAGGRYFCRVSGTGIVDVLGKDSTNKYMDEVVSRANLHSRVRIFDEALAAARPALYASKLVIPGAEWRHVARLILPFSKGGTNCILSILKFLTPADRAHVDPTPDGDGIFYIRIATPTELDRIR